MGEPRKRKSREVRRREILDAVVAIGADRGLDAVSARDVAVRVGVAPGLIHHYFPSMDELLTESFGAWADEALRRLRELSAGASPRMALALTVAHLSPEQRIWHDALSTASRYAQLRGRARSLSEDYLAHVESIIRGGIDEGVFTCPAPQESAWRIILILDGLVAMVHILDLIRPDEMPGIVGPVVERELGLVQDTFTELVQAVMGRADLPGW